MAVTVAESEYAIIGALVLEPQLWSFSECASDDFADDMARSAYAAISELMLAGDPVDTSTVVDKMGIDYREFILSCVERNPVVRAEHVTAYSRIIREESLRRKAYEKAAELMLMLQERAPVEEIQAAASALTQAATTSGSTDETPISVGVVKAQERQTQHVEYMRTGYKKLDSWTYISRGDYIIVGGRPSSGKTAFTLSIAADMAKRHNVVFFSLETSKDKIIDRLITTVGRLNFEAVKRREMEDWGKFNVACLNASQLKFTVVEAAGKTVSWIQAKALKLGADIAIIDYIGLIDSPGASRYEKVTNISLSLHTMAQRTGIVVIALSQLRRSESRVPCMSDLRESGQIEQDADLIILLHNGATEEAPHNYTVMLEKNKEGRTGLIPFQFFGETQSFFEGE